MVRRGHDGRVGGGAAPQPGGSQAGAVGAVDVPGVCGDEQGFGGGGVEVREGVFVGRGGWFPGAGCADVEECFEAVAQAGAGEEGFGGGGGAVGEGREAQAGGVQCVDGVGDVGVDVEVVESVEDVCGGAVCVAVPVVEAGEQCAQGGVGDGAEVGVGACGGEGESVA